MGRMGLGALSCFDVSRAVVRAELALNISDTPRTGARLPPVFSADEADVHRISYHLA